MFGCLLSAGVWGVRFWRLLYRFLVRGQVQVTC
jgi:hypothetical protein